MKQIEIHLFEISELLKIPKNKALEYFRYINIDYSEWSEPISEDFIDICKTIGITIKPGSISFNGFYYRDEGSSFEGDVDIIELINGVNEERWKVHPDINVKLSPLSINPLVLNLIVNKKINCKLKIKRIQNRNDINLDMEYTLPFHDRYKNIPNEMQKLELWIEGIVNSFNAYLFKQLKDEYEYHTSDDIVEETIKMNEYLFTADGTLASLLIPSNV
jgi:hypothetical protein